MKLNDCYNCSFYLTTIASHKKKKKSQKYFIFHKNRPQTVKPTSTPVISSKVCSWIFYKAMLYKSTVIIDKFLMLHATHAYDE